MLKKLKLNQTNGFLIKNTCNYMDQNSTINCVVWVKANSVSNYTLSVQKYVIHKTNIRARIKNIIPSLF